MYYMFIKKIVFTYTSLYVYNEYEVTNDSYNCSVRRRTAFDKRAWILLPSKSLINK